MKKYILITLISIFVLILTACDAGEDSSGMPELAPLHVENKRVECDWTLHVDDTIYVEKEGIAVKHNLIIDAYKQGGKDDLGIYTGKATLHSEADLSALTNDAFAVNGKTGGAGTDSKAMFEVVSYDVKVYSPGEELAPILEYDSMALGVFNLNGYGFMDMSMLGADGTQGEGSEQFSSSVPVQFKMLVNGGKVSIEIPSLNLPETFDGMITGSPKN